MNHRQTQFLKSQDQQLKAPRCQSRAERARELRSAALVILDREGKFMISDLYGPSLGWGAKELSMCLCPLRPSTRDWQAVTGKDWMLQLAANQAAPRLTWNLDIWAPQKVMNLRWTENTFDLISLRRGEWEKILLSHSTV